MKEQTPITAEEFYTKNATLSDIDLMEQYAQTKVLEALEREVPKAFEKGYSIGMDDSIAIELRQDPLEIDGKEYHETQVKPKYER